MQNGSGIALVSRRHSVVRSRVKHVHGESCVRVAASRCVEDLERRLFLSADLGLPQAAMATGSSIISGIVYEDLDQSGTQESGEAGVAGWDVFLDLNGDGMLDMGRTPVTSTHAPLDIVDLEWVFETLNVSGFAGTIGDLNVTLNIEHTWSADLIVVLVAPDGSEVELVNTVGGAYEADFTGTVLDDEAAMSINDGAATSPYTGSFRPEMPLSAMDGINPNGVWELWIYDQYQDEVGQLLSWMLDFETNQEPLATTDDAGQYSFLNVPAGTYAVTQVIEPGWVAVSPAGPAQEVTVGDGETAIADFAVVARQSVSGVVFEDDDADGWRDGGEEGLAGRQVYIDANDNGLLDVGETAVTTDEAGAYELTELTPGDYVIRVAPSTGYAVTNTSDGHRVTIKTGAAGPDEVDFGLAAGGVLIGMVYEDVNGDKAMGDGEMPLAGWTVYVDLDRDNVVDASEPQALTNDEGRYGFSNLPLGTNLVAKLIRPSGWIASTNPSGAAVLIAAAETRFVANFGAYMYGAIEGILYTDSNANESYDDPGEAGVSGVGVYLDLNKNGVRDAGVSPEPLVTTNSLGEFSFENLAPGMYRVGVLAAAGKTVISPRGGFAAVQVNSGYAEWVEIGRVNGAAIYGYRFVDDNADGVFDYSEEAVVGAQVYLDKNGNGVFDAGDVATTTDDFGHYAFTGLAAGTYTVRCDLLAGEVSTTTNDGAQTVVFQQTTQNLAVDFGTVTPATVGGFVYADVNVSYWRDAGETGLSDIQVLLDEDGDGVQDAGELVATTGTDGAYLFDVVPPGQYELALLNVTDWVATEAPYPLEVFSGDEQTDLNFGLATGGAISGLVYEDYNFNSHVDEMDYYLSGFRAYLDLNQNGNWDELSEPGSMSDEYGSFGFTGLMPGSYLVRLIAPETGWFAMSEADSSRLLTVASQQDLVEADFAWYYGGIAAGFVYADADEDGGWDVDEVGVQGWTVYADLNGNLALDQGEPAAASADADGYWELWDLPRGSYNIRSLPVAGWDAVDTTFEFNMTQSGQEAWDLELAVVPPGGLVRGRVFLDDNANGVMDVGEWAEVDRAVYLDVNNNKSQDQGEPSARTNWDGYYMIAGVQPGSYQVRAVLDSWTIQIAPAPTDGPWTLTSVDDQVFVPFALAPGAVVRGVVFEDINNDMQYGGADVPLAGQLVFIDRNNDGVYQEGRSTHDAANVPVAIVDKQVSTSALAVSGLDGTIADINVTLNITHDYDADLDIILVSPAGTEVQLVLYAGLSGKNFTNTVLDDEAATGIGLGSAPFTGSFRPEESLGILDGEDPNGTWTLRVRDNAYGDEGQIVAWSVDVTTSESEPASITNAGGEFSFGALDVGTYAVRATLPDGMSFTTPPGGAAMVEVVDGAEDIRVLFGGSAFDGVVDGGDGDDTLTLSPTGAVVNVYLNGNLKGSVGAGATITFNAGAGNDQLVANLAGGSLAGVIVNYNGQVGSDMVAITGGDEAESGVVSENVVSFGTASVNLDGVEVIQVHGVGEGDSVSGSLPANAGKALRLSNVQIGALDLNNNSLIVDCADASSADAMRKLLAGGITGGTLTSSELAKPERRLAVVTAGDLALTNPVRTQFAGQAVNDNSVLVKYTWTADYTFDGQVTTADFAELSKGYVAYQLTGGESRFNAGDSNLDGKVTTADFAFLSKAYVQSQVEKSQGGTGMAATVAQDQAETQTRVRKTHRLPVSRKARRTR